MKFSLNWNKPKKTISFEASGGVHGRLFLANEAKRLMDPYVPADNLILAQNVRTYVENHAGIIEYMSPYAHYQFEGEVYVSSITGSAWSHGEYKIPSGKEMVHSKFRHPLATSHWDRAMKTARKGDLSRAYQAYLNGGIV